MSRVLPTTATEPAQPADAGAADSEIVTRISPMAPGLAAIGRELWQFRHLFVALVWRNIRVEFDATRLGSAWAVARPILFTLVFVMFRGFSGANTHVDVPYGLYVFSGLVLWTYFLDAATASAGAIRVDSALLSKVYYPRLLTPIVPVVSSLVNVAIAVVPLAVMMLWYGVHPGLGVVLLPLVILQSVALALGIGLLVSSISIENRDWERALAFVLSIGLWLSPVVYSPRMIPGLLYDLYHLNPMVGVLLAFRAVLFDGFPLPVWEWAYSVACTVVVLLIGLWSFRRTEAELADRL